jgi:hypothetical protein
MSTASSPDRLTIPETLQKQLREFRKRVWTTKMIEFFAIALTGMLIAYAIVFVADRIWDTPWQIRLSIFLGSLAVWSLVPWAFHRWVWGNRKLEQVARLLRKREPNIGDQLLGVLELASSETEQARSRALCAAAIGQVAEAAKKRDLTKAAPPSRYRKWSIIAAALLATSSVAAFAVPEAAFNAWARFFTPWKSTPRYTFAQLEKLPDRWVVPHGEAVNLNLKLTNTTKWQPQSAKATIPYLPPMVAPLKDLQYQLDVPPLTDTTSMSLRVGDLTHKMQVEPKLRPELAAMSAKIQLPAYLNISKTVTKDIRSGAVQGVAGSSVQLEATISQPLLSAQVNSVAVSTSQDHFETPSKVLAEGTNDPWMLSWVDTDQLAGREPLKVRLEGLPDEAPSLAIEGLMRQLVVLDSEQLNFNLTATDDFGVQRVGLEWKGIDGSLVDNVAKGESILSSGGPEQNNLTVPAVFTAKDNGIEPQPIELRVWVEDYLPNRPRVYSAPYTLYVLSPDEHAIWVTEQLNRWHRQSLEVRDREIQLNQANKKFREMARDELNTDEMRKQIETQAGAEQANARRLNQLGQVGEQLLRQASRNPEIGVGHLNRWAEMQGILKDIAGKRMPSVADLLEKAATAPPSADQTAANSKPAAGQMRDANGGSPGSEEKKGDEKKQPDAPTLVDQESSQNPADDKKDPSGGSKSNKPGRLTLPTTTIASSGSQKSQPQQQDEAVEEAIRQQDDLLAEFQKLSDEMSNLLGNLEGSTLVKRLKAASREQLLVASRISDRIATTFGRKSDIPDADKQALTDLTKVESKSVDVLSTIMDDMQAYFDRRPLKQFKVVLDEMREVDLLSGIRSLADDIPKEQGLSIAQAEFWSDNLDRWADDLVDPASNGSCPGSKSRDSLPPSIVLEVLQILEAEVNLREETRVAEKAKAAVGAEKHKESAFALSEKQGTLTERVSKVNDRIKQLPEAEIHFEKEMALLGKVENVMAEAEDILNLPETGAIAIATETEAIELLLQSRKINPRSGGGSGTSPGGGGEGTTSDLAMALTGEGINEKEEREFRDVSPTTGETGAQLPEEFRAGLDQYFNRLEKQTEK